MCCSRIICRELSGCLPRPRPVHQRTMRVFPWLVRNGMRVTIEGVSRSEMQWKRDLHRRSVHLLAWIHRICLPRRSVDQDDCLSDVNGVIVMVSRWNILSQRVGGTKACGQKSKQESVWCHWLIDWLIDEVRSFDMNPWTAASQQDVTVSC